jgi:DNA-binding NtrC family response regulator
MKRWKVLVVEDDYSLQQLYKMEFTEAGLDIHLAGNGLEAGEILMREKVDLIITDIRMPKEGGEAVLDWVELNHVKTPVIVVSAFTHYREIFEKEGRPMVAYFTKPVDFRDLIVFVQGYLKSQIPDEGKVGR